MFSMKKVSARKNVATGGPKCQGKEALHPAGVEIKKGCS